MVKIYPPPPNLARKDKKFIIFLKFLCNLTLRATLHYDITPKRKKSQHLLEKKYDLKPVA